jgi:signal transduction histidine kinase
LNRVLDQRGTDMYAPRATQAYLWRSRAAAALGKDRDAYADLAEYTRRTTELGRRKAPQQCCGAARQVRNVRQGSGNRARPIRGRRRTSRGFAPRLERNLVALSAVLLVFTVLSSTWLWRRRKKTDDMRRAAEDRLAFIGRLTGGVAHEFNNLMTVIQQAVGLLAQRPMVSTDAAARSLVTEIQQASNVCADVTTQLLSFARQQNLKPETFNVDEFLTGISSMLEIVAGPAIKLKVLVDKSALAIHADRRQFTAVLRNLVSNARDAMGEGGTLTIRVIVDSDNFVRIDLVDEGHGMSVQTLEHAVEPFFTTKPVGAGSGLG